MQARKSGRRAELAGAGFALLTGLHGHAAAQAIAPAAPTTQAATQATTTDATPVIVTGVVPDEATLAAVLRQVQAIYGSRVVNRLEVGSVVAPANWSQHVQGAVSPSLRQVSHGQLVINGNDIALEGEVSNDAQRQQIATDLAAGLNPTYTVRNGLRVSAKEQAVLDATLANRNIEFEAGSSVLRPAGRAVLDEMAAALLRIGGKKVEVIGHTDSVGSRDANLALSMARADAVRVYLVGKGLPAASINTSGSGPDRPIASNDTAEGRARNRRIEFRVGQ